MSAEDFIEKIEQAGGGMMMDVLTGQVIYFEPRMDLASPKTTHDENLPAITCMIFHHPMGMPLGSGDQGIYSEAQYIFYSYDGNMSPIKEFHLSLN